MLQPEEVVEVFVGDTLEEAMAFAVAALGPDLSVRRARKVRKGVQGLVGRDRYEVVAVPAPRSEGALESAFEALLSQAEEAETLPDQRRAGSRRTTRPHPAPEVAEHQAPAAELQIPFQAAVPALEGEPELPAPAPAAKPRIAAPVAAGRVKAQVRAPAVAPPAEAEVAVRPRRAPAKPRAKARPIPTGWSRQALVELGLPEAVLAGLPADEPGDDLGWVVALAVAMSAVLPAPAALDADHPLVVNGYGLPGVLGLLDAAARGLTPGTITVGTRTAAATATELALAVRTAVVG